MITLVSLVLAARAQTPPPDLPAPDPAEASDGTSPEGAAAPAEPASQEAVPPSTDSSQEPVEPPAPELDVDALLREAEAFMADTPQATIAAAPAAAAPASPNVFNPMITAFGDLLVPVGIDADGVMPGSAPYLRSFELDVRADVDPFAKAVAVIALEQEPPDLAGNAPLEEEPFGAAPEEVYIDLVSLPGGLSARVGQFKQPFGIVNKAHPHDFPWPDLPPAVGAILGGEGYADTGAVLSWRIPNPWDTGLTIEGGALSGNPLDDNAESAAPAWLGRGEFFGHAGNWDLGLGASTLAFQGQRTDGADLMLRWRASSWRSVVLVAEALRDDHAWPITDPALPDAEYETLTGGYLALQIQPTRPLYLGLRGDRLGEATGYGAWLSYYTSEFLRLRAGAQYTSEALATLTDFLAAGEAVPVTDGYWTATAQLTFVWGSHPVEPYWVNR